MIAPPGKASLSPGEPLNLTSTELKKLENSVHMEVSEALEDHEERESRIDEYQRLYDGEPKQKQRNFPWPKAANLEIPLVGFTTDSIVARILNTIFAMDPFWTVRPLRKETDLVARPVEHYLEWSRKAEYDLYKEVKPAVIQTTKFGWSWLKFGWEHYSRREYTLDQQGNVILMDEVVRRPVVYHVSSRDMIVQAGVEDEEMAELLIHRFRLTKNQLMMRDHDNIYQDTDKVIKYNCEDEDADPMNDRRRTRDKLRTGLEINWDYPIDGIPTPIVLTWHHETKTILRAIHNPYPWRPYEKLTFIEREGQLEGFGIARRLYQLQEEVSTIHRQEVDNATLANTRFFLGKRGEVKDGTRIWPGRFLPVSDPDKSVKAVALGDIGLSLRALEVQALGYAERASGISDPQLGRESSLLGSRATATGTLAMIQEGNRRFDLNIRDIRESLGTVGRRVLELNQRFRPRGAAYFVEGSDGDFVEQVLDLPPNFSAAKIAVDLTASTATINREVEKQGLIGLLGVMTQYYGILQQGMMIMLQPNLPGAAREMAIKVAQSAKHVVDKIVQDFDIKDIDTVVPTLIQAEQMNANFVGNPGAPQGAGNQPGMGGVFPPGGPMDQGRPGGAGGIGQLQ